MKKILLLAIILVSITSCRGDWDYKTNPHDDNPPLPPQMDISLSDVLGKWKVVAYNFAPYDYPYKNVWHPISEITRNHQSFTFELFGGNELANHGEIRNLETQDFSKDHIFKFKYYGGTFDGKTGKPSGKYKFIGDDPNPYEKKDSYNVYVHYFHNDTLIISTDNVQFDFILHGYSIGELKFIRVKQ